MGDVRGQIRRNSINVPSAFERLKDLFWDNVITRAEVRWDHSLNSDRPYGNDNEKNAVTLTANIVYKF